MARQKKDTSTSILRRVLDRTPLRPAHLDSFRSAAATSPAQFAARYFERNSGIIRRWLSIGGESSPLHRPIGRNIVARYTTFNQAFGPIQRALRPQPEHQPRKRHPLEESYDGYEAEDSANFDYAQEPDYFDRPEPVYAQPDYAVTTPSPMPWEGPLNSTSLPVAQRLDFQPANLRYLTNPERQLEPAYRPERTQAAVERSFQASDAFTAPPFQAPPQPAPANYAQSTDFTIPANPAVARPADFAAPPNQAPGQASDFAERANPEVVRSTDLTESARPEVARSTDFTAPVSSSQSNAFANPVSPALAQSSDYSGPVRQEAASGYVESAFTPAPVYRPLVQPALSRAIQRTADATVDQPGAGNLGASPAAITRRLALPGTVARYRALKQAADKVLLGEQPAELAREADASQYLEPQITQPQFNPASAQRAAQAENSLLEVQRIQAETRALLETQRLAEETRQPVEDRSPVNQPGQFVENQRPVSEVAQFVENQGLVNQAGQPVEGPGVAQAAVQPGDVQRTGEPTANRAPESGPNLTGNRPAQENQGLIETPGNFLPGEAPATVARLSRNAPVSRGGVVLSGEPAYQSGEAVIQRNIQANNAPGRTADSFNRPEVAPALFDAAIPASLLDNNLLPGEISPEVQRLVGNRLNGPVRTTAWANNLAALRNNPGVAAGPAAIARQLSDAETGGVDAWSSGSGAGVYASPRRVRRNETVAAETQDRIFSLAETNNGLADFQPQLVKAMALEEAAPLPLNRSQVTSPVPSSVAPVLSPVAPVNPEATTGRDNSITSTSNPDISRVYEANLNNADFAVASERPALAKAASIPAEEQIGAFNQAAPVEGQTSAYGQAVPGESWTSSNGQPIPVEGQSGASRSAIQAANQVEGQTDPAISSSNLPQTFLADGQAGEYGQATSSGGPVQRTIQFFNPQTTALQRAFKRMDFESPGSDGLAESPSLSLGNFPFSYAARPGFRRDRSSLADMETSGESPYFEGSYRETGPADFAAQPAREFSPELPVARLYREPVSESPAARINVEPDAAASPTGEPFFNAEQNAAVSPAREAAAFEEVAARPVQQPVFEEVATRLGQQPVFEDGLAQPSGETGFEGTAASPGPASPGGAVAGIQRSNAVTSGEAAGFNQPRYFKNGLEATWLSPENRLFVERLPGGSSALQRLLQAPGQLQSFFEITSAASALDLPALRNNPGLSANIARSLEEPGGFSVEGWARNNPLSFVQRRRVARSNQAGSQVEFEGGRLPGDYQGFEPAFSAQSEGLPASLAATPPEAVQRTSLTRPEASQPATQAGQPGISLRPSAAPPAQPGIFQADANQETAARIQRNYAGAVEPGQSNPAASASGSFTISGDWIAQLQNRFEGFSVGQLNGPTGLVMRLLTEDGEARQSMNVSNFGTAPAFETGPGFNYAVPPLLWRKVSDYAPDSGMGAFSERSMLPEQGPVFTSPGEVLRAFDREDPVYNRSEEALAPTERTSESASSARLDLPMLRQTHVLLQRIANLEKTNTSLELAQRMEAAGQANSNMSVSGLGQANGSLPMPGVLQRLSEPGSIPGAIQRLGEPTASETGSRPAAPAPLRMADVPVNRPGESRFLEVDPEVLEDAAVASPAPEIRTVEVRVPDNREYRTPLETAAARNSFDGPNIGQGEILQPLAIQRKAATPTQTATYAPLVQPTLHTVIKTSVGKTLDHPVQRRMTNIFGAHFQDVRVHTGEEAAQATRHVGAEAFTLGSDIYFAPGRYQPDTHAGQALIGHELTHVIQQSSLPSLGNGRIPETSSVGQTLEHHAIANEQLILRHLSSTNGDHDHSLSSSQDGRLSFYENHFSPSYSTSTASATIERSYQPVADQNSHPPINQSHLRNDNGPNSDSNDNGSSVQRVMSGSGQRGTVQRALLTDSSNPVGNSTSVDDMIDKEQEMNELARKVYQIIRDELMIERERGFGPSNKFF